MTAIAILGGIIVKLIREDNKIHQTKCSSGKNWKFTLSNGMPIKIAKKEYNAIYGVNNETS